jgi:excisionase family DNA binding protein
MPDTDSPTRRTSRTYLPVEGTREELVDFADTIHTIERYLANHNQGAALVAPDGTHRPIPAEIFRVLEHVTTALANGRGVTIAPYEALLTTQEAADYLGVSRPTLVKLLEQRAIPFETRGRHRRVTLRDLVDYQDRFRVERRRTLREIAREGQASGRVRQKPAVD